MSWVSDFAEITVTVIQFVDHHFVENLKFKFKLKLSL